MSDQNSDGSNTPRPSGDSYLELTNQINPLLRQIMLDHLGSQGEFSDFAMSAEYHAWAIETLYPELIASIASDAVDFDPLLSIHNFPRSDDKKDWTKMMSTLQKKANEQREYFESASWKVRQSLRTFFRGIGIMRGCDSLPQIASDRIVWNTSILRTINWHWSHSRGVHVGNDEFSLDQIDRLSDFSSPNISRIAILHRSMFRDTVIPTVIAFQTHSIEKGQYNRMRSPAHANVFTQESEIFYDPLVYRAVSVWSGIDGDRSRYNDSPRSVQESYMDHDVRTGEIYDRSLPAYLCDLFRSVFYEELRHAVEYRRAYNAKGKRNFYLSPREAVLGTTLSPGDLQTRWYADCIWALINNDDPLSKDEQAGEYIESSAQFTSAAQCNHPQMLLLGWRRKIQQELLARSYGEDDEDATNTRLQYAKSSHSGAAKMNTVLMAHALGESDSPLSTSTNDDELLVLIDTLLKKFSPEQMRLGMKRAYRNFRYPIDESPMQRILEDGNLGAHFS